MTTKTTTSPPVKTDTAVTTDANGATATATVEAPKEATVRIAAAKGRPMLSWVGKRPLGLITAFPAQPVERFDPQHVLGMEQADTYSNGGLLFHGDNKEVLAHLLASGFRGKVNLIYIDPPFDSGADYVRKVSLRGGASGTKLEGETYTLGEQTQYTDIWANDNYLQFMYERLLIMKELLAEDGFLFVHLNAARVHYIKLMMDEVFGEDNFRNEITVKRIKKSYSEPKGIRSLNEGGDYILMYAKSPSTRFKQPMMYAPKEDRWHSFDAPNERKNLSYALLGIKPPAGRCWARTEAESKLMIEAGTLRANPSSGWPEYYLPATEYISRDSLWSDVTASSFKTGYPTEKKESLLELIIAMTSKPGNLVLDCFMGSGTTAAVAQKLGHRWIGCDINKGAIQTTSKRLQSILTEQISAKDKPAAKKDAPHPKLDVDDTAGADDTAAEVPATTQPAQLAFSIWRVNDYDLQIQHNEAVELACQHLGITRTKGDSFFEGTRGQMLVKVVPFNHPLSPLDLEEVKIALDGRPDETRSVLMVCLGVELAAQGWIEDWNRLRKKDDPNRIDYIELRTDSKYGKFFEHKSASAQVKVTRHGKTGKVKIENFVSPTILERLAQAAGVLSPRIDDWRAMVDCVLIDAAYDGKVFNVTLSDVPEKKNDLVAGEYELPLPQKPTTVGVKIIDMLGEEVLETAQV